MKLLIMMMKEDERIPLKREHNDLVDSVNISCAP